VPARPSEDVAREPPEETSMTRHSKGRAKKKGGGLLMGMRSGVQHLAGEGTDATAKKKSNLIWNIITAILVLVTAAILLRRFGVIHF
jgi:hypothetical protein